MIYVTYEEAGNLTGKYDQELHPDHAMAFIEVTAEQGANWLAYKANAMRDGLEPADPPQPVPAPVPHEVTRRQGLEALFDMYQLKDTDIEAAIIAHVTDPAAQYKALNEFKTSQTFKYDRPLVVLMCQVLNLDRPALFTYAKTL